MAVTRDDVLKIAHLARLELSDSAIQKYTGELNAILGYIDTLNTLDTDAIEPTASVSHRHEGFRPDQAVQTPPEMRADVFSQAPDTDGTVFRVPQVIA